MSTCWESAVFHFHKIPTVCKETDKGKLGTNFLLTIDKSDKNFSGHHSVSFHSCTRHVHICYEKMHYTAVVAAQTSKRPSRMRMAMRRPTLIRATRGVRSVNSPVMKIPSPKSSRPPSRADR